MSSPNPSEPSTSWEHYSLYHRVIDAVYAVPAHFVSRTTIEGLAATDLQTLNTVLGATIEQQVVATLNGMRSAWDPSEQYQRYFFQRQAQVFPDVLLKADQNGQDIVLGIELKGWYLLAKEQMPNFRFQVTPAACAEADLVVVVPWALSNVLSGVPITYKPFVTSARYAAEHRNHWWVNIRQTKSNTRIDTPVNVRHYPSKSDAVTDYPASDGGGNFGRLARTGIMDEYIAETLNLPLAGIPARSWIDFLKQFEQ